jgi:hypothetical protein
MFSALLSPNFMPSFGKIVGADFEICRYPQTHGRTYGRTHGGYLLIDPRFGNRRPTSTEVKWSPESEKANFVLN